MNYTIIIVALIQLALSIKIILTSELIYSSIINSNQTAFSQNQTQFSKVVLHLSEMQGVNVWV